jgi:hypothetical protein
VAFLKSQIPDFASYSLGHCALRSLSSNLINNTVPHTRCNLGVCWGVAINWLSAFWLQLKGVVPTSHMGVSSLPPPVGVMLHCGMCSTLHAAIYNFIIGIFMYVFRAHAHNSTKSSTKRAIMQYGYSTVLCVLKVPCR